MLVKISVKDLRVAVVGSVVGKPCQQIFGGAGVGIDRRFGINVVLALIVVHRVKEVGELRILAPDGGFSVPAAAVARGGDHGRTGRVKNMVVGQRFVVVIQTVPFVEQSLFMPWQLCGLLGVFLPGLPQLLAAELFRLFAAAHIVRIGNIGFKIVVVVEIVFKSHVCPPFAVME